MLGPNLATCELSAWPENTVKLKLKLGKKWRRKPNKNKVGIKLEAQCKLN